MCALCALMVEQDEGLISARAGFGFLPRLAFPLFFSPHTIPRKRQHYKNLTPNASIEVISLLTIWTLWSSFSHQSFTEAVPINFLPVSVECWHMSPF